MTSRPKLQIDTRKCVEACPSEYREIFNRCFTSNQGSGDSNLSSFLLQVVHDLLKTSPEILMTIVVTISFSYIILILFRYAIEYIIWIIYIVFNIVLAAIAEISLSVYLKDGNPAAIISAVSFGLWTTINVIVLVIYRKRIKLVAQFFKEASKAVIGVPSILFEPILTLIALIVVSMLFSYNFVVIELAGDIHIDISSNILLKQSSFTKFAQYFNYVAFFWFTQFIYGCQHFVIAGNFFDR